MKLSPRHLKKSSPKPTPNRPGDQSPQKEPPAFRLSPIKPGEAKDSARMYAMVTPRTGQKFPNKKSQLEEIFAQVLKKEPNDQNTKPTPPPINREIDIISAGDGSSIQIVNPLTHNNPNFDNDMMQAVENQRHVSHNRDAVEAKRFMRGISKDLSRKTKTVQQLVSSNYLNEKKYLSDIAKIDKAIEEAHKNQHPGREGGFDFSFNKSSGMIFGLNKSKDVSIPQSRNVQYQFSKNPTEKTAAAPQYEGDGLDTGPAGAATNTEATYQDEPYTPCTIRTPSLAARPADETRTPPLDFSFNERAEAQSLGQQIPELSSKRPSQPSRNATQRYRDYASSYIDSARRSSLPGTVSTTTRMATKSTKSTKGSARFSDINWTFVREGDVWRKTRNRTQMSEDYGENIENFKEQFYEILNHNVENYFDAKDIDNQTKRLEYFINQDTEPQNIQAQHVEMAPHIQYSNISRAHVAESDIPLEAIYNDKINQIKKFEQANGRDVAPIQISMLKDLNNKDEKKQNSVVQMIRCDDYGVRQSHQISKDDEIIKGFGEIEREPRALYLSFQEGRSLRKKYENSIQQLQGMVGENAKRPARRRSGLDPFESTAQIDKEMIESKMAFLKDSLNQLQVENPSRFATSLSIFRGTEPSGEIRAHMKKQLSDMQWLINQFNHLDNYEYRKSGYSYKTPKRLQFEQEEQEKHMKQQLPHVDIDDPTGATNIWKGLLHKIQSPPKSQKQKVQQEKKQVQKKKDKVNEESTSSSEEDLQQETLIKLDTKRHRYYREFIKDTALSGEELESRLVQLTIQLMNKSSILSLRDGRKDEKLNPLQEQLRRERILNVTHMIFKHFQVDVMIPKVDYIIANNGAKSSITTNKIGQAIDESNNKYEKLQTAKKNEIPSKAQNKFGLNIPIRKPPFHIGDGCDAPVALPSMGKFVSEFYKKRGTMKEKEQKQRRGPVTNQSDYHPGDIGHQHPQAQPSKTTHWKTTAKGSKIQTSNRTLFQRYVEEGRIDPDGNYNVREQRDAALDAMRDPYFPGWAGHGPDGQEPYSKAAVVERILNKSFLGADDPRQRLYEAYKEHNEAQTSAIMKEVKIQQTNIGRQIEQAKSERGTSQGASPQVASAESVANKSASKPSAGRSQPSGQALEGVLHDRMQELMAQDFGNKDLGNKDLALMNDEELRERMLWRS